MNNNKMTGRSWMTRITAQGGILAVMVLMIASGMGCGSSAEKWYQKGEDAYYGRGRSQSDEEAAKFYRKAAERGHAEAQNKLGTMFKEGRGVAQNDEEAVSWFRKAAEQGLADAQCGLGVMYSDGLGVEKDDSIAASWYRKAVEQGSARGQRNLGGLYLYGDGVEQDDGKAIELFRKAAEQGYAGAQSSLGWMYEQGRGVERDYEMAVSWYRKAAEQGDVFGQYCLGGMYKSGHGVEKDDEEAVKWYQKAAEQGDADAQCNLAWMYSKGRGVEQDYDEALSWYRKAAEQGQARGQYNLGEIYWNGLGVEESREEALSWFRKAADQGYAAAQKKLGEAYEDGLGVTKDYEEALRWYRNAAKQGNIGALHCLGRMFELGYGVEKDDKKALALYRKAAEQGYADSQFILGCRYAKGRGVEQNQELAMEWYRKAANQGHDLAWFNLEMMTATEEEKAEFYKYLSDTKGQLYADTFMEMLADPEGTGENVHQAGDTMTITLPGGATMEMVWCPPGTFMMGEFEFPMFQENDEILHEVTLSQGFWMAKTEVTQKQWMSVEARYANPSEHQGDDLPVECVNWHDCEGFCQRAGLELPTEAEWEYACRAGSTGDFGGTGKVETMGWCGEAWGAERLHPVGQKKPNAWGLYDMHGNVREWCADYYGDYPEEAVTDPTGSVGGLDDFHVLRGGASGDKWMNCRSAARFKCPPSHKGSFYGFRPVLRED